MTSRTLSAIETVPADLALRFQLTYLHPIFAGYAAALAVFILWRVGRRPGANELSFVLGLMSLALALSVVPQQWASTGHKLAFGTVWGVLVFQVIHFWTRFPQIMDLEKVTGLARQRGTGMWYDGPNRLSARLTHAVLSHKAGWATLVLLCAAFGWVLSGPDVSPYNFLGPRIETGGHYLAYAGPIGLLHGVVTASVAWTSFRLSRERGRRQVLWIMQAHLITSFGMLMILILYPLAALTGSGVLVSMRDGLMTVFQPMGWALTLTGYAIALFLVGAFDLRPMITRSTVYGMSLILLTFVFACVEEVVEAQVSTRIQLPDGVGTWAGAAAIAVCMGPVRDRVASLLRRWVPDLHAQDGQEDP